MKKFAIIDTETNWEDKVMSIGVVIADSRTFEPLLTHYWIITPEYERGGMFFNALFLEDKKLNVKCTRKDSLDNLMAILYSEEVTNIFAYNASFDYRHLPELSHFRWRDIMSLSAYKQHNHAIGQSADCYKTGRLKRGYGVENIYKLLSGEIYQEQHNALHDAIDELKIMQMLSHDIEKYPLLFSKHTNTVSHKKKILLSSEQQLFIDKALQGKSILVDACIGSGKTTAIQYLCDELPTNKKILYLTYNKLLKLDAKSKIKNKNVTVNNYHGFAYGMLIKSGIRVGISDLIQVFLKEKPIVEHYDVLIIDEYQDIEQELSELLEYVKLVNSNMQIIAVGDMEQKIYDKTTLSVSEFISEFLEEYTELQFTQCFRLSKDLAAKLSRIWQKDINGINSNCIVEEMSLENVVKFLSEQKTKDVLCLGARVGQMADALNQLEEKYPETFNKKTVFASISDRNGTGATQPKKTSAIFTTFDSSKGLERDICVVFDFTESYWDVRIKKPQQSYEILRNIFCVAASRGKKHIIFVKYDETMLSEETLSENTDEKQNFSNVNISEMFDFKYKEDIEKCYSLLNISLISKLNDLSEIKI